MIPITFLEGEKIVVFGLGKSGLATAAALRAGGALPYCCDDHESSLAEARAQGFEAMPMAQIPWAECKSLILSPGVPLTHPEPHPVVIKAEHEALDIVGDVELFFLEREFLDAKDTVIAITGTNGKSTTTALTTHMLNQIGEKAVMGGNIGVPVLSLPPFGSGHTYVLELSSFQIDLTPSLKPTVGVLLNVSEDHLDRHGSMEHYASLKELLALGAEFPIVVTEDRYTKKIAQHLELMGRDFLPIESASFADNMRGHPVLRGDHNVQNAVAAFAVGWKLQYEPPKLMEAIYSFAGLAHRMEVLGRIGKVLFVNDSKATNADSTEKALKSYDNLYWIVGGRAKSDGIDPLVPLFDKIRHAFLIGEAAPAFAEVLGAHGVAFTHCGDVGGAVLQAFQVAQQSGDDVPVVMFSPSCASFDQYKNFEQRGEHFRECVQALAAAVAEKN